MNNGFNNTPKDLKCFALTYYICTERSESMSPAHVEMCGVETLEEADVIKTLRLEEGRRSFY